MADSVQDQLQSSLGAAYTIDRELGGGGMSRVFLATENALGRQVVVKILREEIGAAISPERFSREVRLAASLQHPNIVTVLTAGSGGDAPPYYTMPFVRGSSLRERMQQGPMPLPEAVSLLRDVARALGFAHDNRVVHRDIKPENVLISGDAALVTDFGIAKAISAATAAEAASNPSTLVTDLGMHLGTPAYMSPEQGTGDIIGPPTDVYAWGVMAYELLAGVHPFSVHTTHAKLLAAHISETPAPLASYKRRIPPALADLVMRCMAKASASRPPNGAAIVRELDAIALAVSARRSYIPSSRRGWMIAAAVVLVLFAVVFFLTMTPHAGASAGNPRSIAVMPFKTVGGDSSNAYFAEGMASELTGALTKIPSLSVASQTSAFALRKRDSLDAREIGKLLNVGALLEGTVRRAGNRLRVTTSLSRTSDGRSLWSDTYEGDAKNVFAVQDSIARAVAGALSARLATGSAAPGGAGSPVAGTKDPEAHDFFMRGRYLLERRGQGVTRAADYFSQAIARDSAYAAAYASLAEALELFPYFAGVSAASVEARATAAATRALALDPTLAEAHVALAMAQQHAHHWPAAGAEYQRAMALDSASSSVRTQYGRYLQYTVKVAEALAQFRAAERLAPSDGTPQVWAALALSNMGQHPAALAEAQRAWETDSVLYTSRTTLAQVSLEAGRNGEALARLGDAAHIPLPFRGLAANVLYRIGRRAAADSIVAGLRAIPSDTWMIHTTLAFAYLGAPDTTRALEELERAVQAREIVHSWHPFFEYTFDPVRHTPRFAAVLRSVDLDPKVLAASKGGRP